MKTYKILFITTLAAAGLASCSSGKGVNDKAMANRLAYQATTSLAALNSIQGEAKGPALRRFSKAEGVISPEKKQEIQELLPTVSLLVENDSTFNSTVGASDRPEYEYKQVVSFFDITSKSVSYTLYYSLGSDTLTSGVENLPTAPEEQAPVKQRLAKSHDDDDDVYERDDKESKESITTFDGIAVVGNEEFDFTARSSEEVEDNEAEKKFALRIFTGVEDSYIDVVHEIETETDEIEEEYTYRITENGVVVHEFGFEHEKELEDGNPELEIKLVINGEKFSFKIIEENGDTFYRVKYDNKVEDEGKAIFKRVITTAEDGSETVSFEEVVK